MRSAIEMDKYITLKIDKYNTMDKYFVVKQHLTIRRSSFLLWLLREQTPTGLMEKLMVRTEKHAMNLAGQVKQATAEVELERKRVYNLLHALLPR